MKALLFIALLALPSLSLAKDPDKVIEIVPSLHVGIGVEMATGENQTDYGMLLAKGYVLQMGESEIGVKLLGLGVKVNSPGEVALLISPACFYVSRICAGPELIKPSIDKTNFGMSLNYEF